MKTVYLLCLKTTDSPDSDVVPTGEVFISPIAATELRDIRNARPEGAPHVVLSGALYEPDDKTDGPDFNAGEKSIDALRKFIKWYDDELSNHDGEYPQADTGCIECTEGCVPNNRNTGLCAYHNAKSVLRKIDKEATYEDLV